MPHVNSSGGDDLASTDEVKVYKDEGDEEKPSSGDLSEDKLGLVTESEEGKSSTGPGSSSSQPDEKPSLHGGIDRLLGHPIPGYVVTPYPYPNGATLGSLGPPHPGALASLMMYNNDHFSPPPAHMGIPPVHIDPKTGLPRPMYHIPPPPHQFPHHLYSPEFSQVQWSGPPGYPITSSGLRAAYPSPLVTSAALSRFSPPGIITHHPGMHPGLAHPAIITPGPKQEVSLSPHSQENHRHHHNLHDHYSNSNLDHECSSAKKKNHIKKPLNAFMIFMKEMRSKVIAESTLKESAAINQLLGRRWHGLDRSEQAKYYDMARKEKELHMQLYPGWSARDNYATHNKKKKRKREPGQSDDQDSGMGGCVVAECNNPKKCRARFGVDAQNQWCKPCRSEGENCRELGTELDNGDTTSVCTVSSSLQGWSQKEEKVH